MESATLARCGEYAGGGGKVQASGTMPHSKAAAAAALFPHTPEEIIKKLRDARRAIGENVVFSETGVSAPPLGANGSRFRCHGTG